MKKIVVVTYGMKFGGCEKVIANICNGFSRDNIECNIITFMGWDSVYKLNKSINHIKVSEEDEEVSGIEKIKKAYRIRKIIKKINPDRILIMPEEISSIMIPFLLDLKIPIVVSERNNPAVKPEKKINRILRFIFYRFAKGYVFQTRQASEFFSKSIQRKSTIILNPLDIERIPKEVSEVRMKEIVSVGRLEEQKNHKLLIRAFAKFSKTHNDYKLIIFGNGSLKEELTELARELIDIDKFEFYPATNDVLEKIKNSSMFVLSSNYEGLPNVLIEAMACGIPCISTDCPAGGPRELIENGKNGLLVPVNSDEKLVEAMTKISEDKEFAKTISKEGKKIIHRTSPKKIIKEWKNYIEEVC